MKKIDRRAPARLRVSLIVSQVSELDAWIKSCPEPRPSREEAFNLLLARALKLPHKMQPKRRSPSVRSADRKFATKAAGKQIDIHMQEDGQTHSVRSARKRSLTHMPSELSQGRRRHRTRPSGA